ncbi:MAG TPA: protoporphyrinogen oxidase, partial [Thermoanaerobaculia bacterium]|nr:protoporphyrinogen oxidase [Thermoanaerobaculia bacterium]
MPDALVLGVGISGLAAARALRREGAAVLLLEAAELPGGTFRSAAAQGFTAELGPSTVQESPELRALAEDAGAADRLVPAAAAARRRWIVHRGRLVPLPGSPPGLVATPLLSWRGKARLATEPWRRRRRGEDGDESVAAFVRRRLGAEPAAGLADAMVLGIYAGDPEELAAAYAFPRLAALEREHGSLFAGMRRGGRLVRRLVGARGGWQSFAGALAEGLPIETGCRVESVARAGSGFRVGARQAGAVRAFEAPRLVVALP